MKIRTTITVEHSKDCRCAGDWVLPKSEFIRGRDVTGRINKKSWGMHFLVYRCNDPSCPAQLLAAEREVGRAIGLCR